MRQELYIRNVQFSEVKVRRKKILERGRHSQAALPGSFAEKTGCICMESEELTDAPGTVHTQNVQFCEVKVRRKKI
jgi:hypothetical protein